MNKLSLQRYKALVKKYGMLESPDGEVLMGCNVWMKFQTKEPFKNPNGTVSIKGIIPMELADEIYNEQMDLDEQTIFNFYNSNTLYEPRLMLKHPEIDVNEIGFDNPSDSQKAIMKAQQEKYDDDYEHCYVDSYVVNSPEGLIFFLEKVLGYYSRKKEETIKQKG